MSTLEEKVAAGVEWLDEAYPDWRTRVVPDTLNMQQSDRDLLSQVTGIGYYDAVAAANQLTGDSFSDEADLWADARGFTIHLDKIPGGTAEDEFWQDRERQWNRLTELWIEAAR